MLPDTAGLEIKDMTAIITEILTAAWTVYLDMAPWLLFGFFCAGILFVLLPQRSVQRHLGGRGVKPVIKASLLGVPLPLCSCSVIPVAASLRQQGAGRSATLSFLLSTPQTGVDSIFVTWSLLGPLFAILRPITAFLSGLTGGVLLEALDGEEQSAPDSHEGEETRSDVKATTTLPAWKRALQHGFMTLPRDIARPLLLGLLVAGLLHWAIPPESLPAILGDGILPMFVLMLAGIPLYVCATASVPIAVALIQAGVSPGAALVFLMTGPASNAASVATITRILGRKAFLVYLATVAGTALISGLLLDLFLIPALPGLVPHLHHPVGPPSFWTLASALILGALLLPSLLPARGTKQSTSCCSSKPLPEASRCCGSQSPEPVEPVKSCCNAEPPRDSVKESTCCSNEPPTEPVVEQSSCCCGK